MDPPHIMVAMDITDQVPNRLEPNFGSTKNPVTNPGSFVSPAWLLYSQRSYITVGVARANVHARTGVGARITLQNQQSAIYFTNTNNRKVYD